MTTARRAIARLRKDDSGQVLMLVIILMLAILLFMVTIPNVTHVTTVKMRAQTSADIGAYTGAIWLARALNLIAVLNTGIRWMYIWMVVLTAVLGIAAALLIASPFFPAVQPILAGICLIFFNVEGIPPDCGFLQAAAKYANFSIPALRRSANDLAKLRDDVASSFPAIATGLGTYMGSKNMGCDYGFPTPRRGGFAFTLPKIAEIELEEDGGGLLEFLESITKPLGGGFGIDGTGEVGGGVDVGDDFGVESRYKVTYHNSATVHQRLFRKDRYAYVRQIYRRSDPKGKKTYKSQKLDMTDDGDVQLRDDYMNPVSSGRYLWPQHELFDYYYDDAFCDFVDDWQEVTRNYDGTKFRLWKELRDDEARQAIIDKYVTGKDTMSPETDQWTKLDYIVESAWITFGDATEWGKPQETPPPDPKDPEQKRALPKKIKEGKAPYVLSFTWRLNTSMPMGLAPVIAGKLFRGHNVVSPLPLFAVAKARPYLDVENPDLDDTLYNPSWDATLAAIVDKDAEAIQNKEPEDEEPEVGQPQKSFNLAELLLSFILTH